MLKHNDHCTGLDYIEETLPYLALQGWYDIDSAKVFTLLSATFTWQSTHRAHQTHLQTIQHEPIIHPVSLHRYHWREKHFPGVCRSIKLNSLWIDQKISKFPTSDSYSEQTLTSTGDTKLVDWCSSMIPMYS